MVGHRVSEHDILRYLHNELGSVQGFRGIVLGMISTERRGTGKQTNQINPRNKELQDRNKMFRARIVHLTRNNGWSDCTECLDNCNRSLGLASRVNVC